MQYPYGYFRNNATYWYRYIQHCSKFKGPVRPCIIALRSFRLGTDSQPVPPASHRCPSPRAVMSTTYHCKQYDTAFRPKALCNWEVPNEGNLRAGATGKSLDFIVDDRGHLLPGQPKLDNSFRQVQAQTMVQRPFHRPGLPRQ